MSRNLVICCDGTNNEFGVNNTNVVRLIQALDRDPAKQRLHYDPGVGTLPEPGRVTVLGKWLSKVGGLAFGAGLSGNIEEAYSYLMDFWEQGDRVFLFGFSRGAYSVRVLAGLLHALGLLPRGNQNLLPYVMRLFGGARNKAKNKDYWNLLEEFRKTFARPSHSPRGAVPVALETKMSKHTYRIKIKGGYFIDDVRESPVDEYQVKLRRTILLVAAVVAAICIAWYFISRS